MAGHDAIAVTAGPHTFYDYLTTRFARPGGDALTGTVPVHRILGRATGQAAR